jgi:hypothetical protein
VKPSLQLLAVLALIAPMHAALAQDAEAKPLVVFDLRPDEEKNGVGLTALSGKCNKDVFRIADVASDPLKVDALKAQLVEQFGLSGDGKTLTVLNWSIYYNKQINHGSSLLKGVGIQGYSLPGEDDGKKPGSKCSQKESAGGWYLGNEVTSVYFPLVSEFLGTFGGKSYNVRVVYSPQVKLPGKFTGAKEDTEAVLGAVHQTAEALTAAIAR